MSGTSAAFIPEHWLTLWSQQPVLLGAAFGLLHAFDADHVSAIGGLAVGDRSASPMDYAVRWAAGHAVALGVISVFVLGLGLWGLTALSGYAEALVALTLLLIGGQALRAARLDYMRLAAPTGHAPNRRARAGVVMGMLHGGAGSAAVIALLPLASFDTGWSSGLYLAFFSLGVGAGACVFSRILGGLFACTERAGEKLRGGLRAAVGVLAIITGALLGLELWHGG